MRRLLALAAASALAVGTVLFAAAPASAAVCSPPALPDPTTTLIEAAPGTTVFFPVPGLCLAPGGTITTSYNPQSATVTWVADGSGSAGFTVDPANDDPAVVPITVLADQGDGTTRSYSFAAYLGASPDVVWPPAAVPTQIAIDPGGEGSFTLPGLYWPRYSECEIRVITVPEDVDFFTEPPNVSGLPIRVGMTTSEFVGKLVISYGLACTPPEGVRSSATYIIELYVGIPIPPPALAATGSDGAPAGAAAVAGGAVVSLGALLLLAARRRRPVD